MSSTMLRYYNRKYIFPSQLVICVAGNVINLIVLGGKNMRTKTNCFLIAMALADLAFFIVMILPNLEHMAGHWLKQDEYRNLYVRLHIPFVAFANWFSATSIWLTVAVTLDRLIATKPRAVLFPYKSWNKRRSFLLITIIYLAALMLSLYHFAWRRVVKRVPANDTTNRTVYVGYAWAKVTQKEPVLYWYVQSSHLLSGLLVVVGPLLLLFVLNCVILHRLRVHNRNVSGSFSSSTRSDRTSIAVERMRRRDRRVTFTVVTLVSVFIMFNLPSGIFSIIEFLDANYVKVIFIRRWYWQLGEACNALVCTGKAINFWLYCIASSDYRRELRNVFTGRRCTSRASAYGDTVERSASLTRLSSSSGFHNRRTVKLQMIELTPNRGGNGMAPLV